MIKRAARSLLPSPILAYLRSHKASWKRARDRPRYGLSRDEFSTILTDTLRVKTGDVVFVHSAVDRLGLGFPFYAILSILREIVGDGGTLVFPTYPRLAAHEALLSGEVFDVRTSASYTGILTEFARRQRDAIRSLNPTKSVTALGPHARELTCSHHESAYPYDRCSPYYKIMDFEAKIIGLGVSTRNLSFVHCVEDELKEGFPVRPYFSRLFEGRCVDYDGREVMVKTYAHDPDKMRWRTIPEFLASNVYREDRPIYNDVQIYGMPFFWADSRALFDRMVDLARQERTIYDRAAYETTR